MGRYVIKVGQNEKKHNLFIYQYLNVGEMFSIQTKRFFRISAAVFSPKHAENKRRSRNLYTKLILLIAFHM